MNEVSTRSLRARGQWLPALLISLFICLPAGVWASDAQDSVRFDGDNVFTRLRHELREQLRRLDAYDVSLTPARSTQRHHVAWLLDRTRDAANEWLGSLDPGARARLTRAHANALSEENALIRAEADTWDASRRQLLTAARDERAAMALTGFHELRNVMLADLHVEPSPRLTRPIEGRIATVFGAVSPTHPDLGRPVSMPSRGVDIRASRDAVVTAMGSGTVVAVDRVPGYGEAVVIDHGGGLRSMLARLWKIELKPGESVASGQSVGRVAPTSLAPAGVPPTDFFEAHVYAEIRVGSTAVDPRTVWRPRSP